MLNTIHNFFFKKKIKNFLRLYLSINNNNNKLSLIDIGAANDLQKRWHNIKNHIEVSLFEPNIESYKKLNKSENISIYNSALFNENCELKFYTTKYITNSSFFIPNSKLLNKYFDPQRFDVINKENIRLTTLDNILPKKRNYDFIKIDVQGAELAILNGAKKTLDDITGIEIEIEFKQIYEKQPLYNEINKFLEKNNFILIDFLNIYRWEQKFQRDLGTIMFCDALYLKNPEFIISKYNTEDKFYKIENYLKILFLYNQVDLIKTLSEKLSSEKKRILNIDILIQYLEKNFKKLLFINKILYKISQLILINGRNHWLN